MQSDVNCEPQVILTWVICAKNLLPNHSGFSPNQLMLGFNPNLSLDIDELTDMEASSSDIIQPQNMDILHTFRQNYIAAKSSKKIMIIHSGLMYAFIQIYNIIMGIKYIITEKF